MAVPDALVEQLATRVAELVLERTAAPSPWLDVEGAAAYLSCQPHRIYDLVAESRLRVAKDGRRSLFRREWLDAVLDVAE